MQLGKPLLRCAQRVLGRRDTAADAGTAFRARLRLGRERGLFRCEPFQRRRCIGDQRVLAFYVLGKLHQPLVKLDDAVLGARFLALQRVAGMVEPLQHGGGPRLGVAQGRHAGGGNRLALGGFGLHAGALRHEADADILAVLGFGNLGARRDPTQVEQRRLGLADLRPRRRGSARPAAPGA